MTQGSKFKSLKVGERIEISYESWRLAKELNNLLLNSKGGGLVIDYGKNDYSSDSLRAIGDHKFKELFDNVGNVDLSVDVDFSLLSDAFQDLNTFGPIPQREFLLSMGIESRLESLVKCNPTLSDEITKSVHRLIGTDSNSMGLAYKVFAVNSKNQTAPWPFQKK